MSYFGGCRYSEMSQLGGSTVDHKAGQILGQKILNLKKKKKKKKNFLEM